MTACACEYCKTCNGSGSIPVTYMYGGSVYVGILDDSYELEDCPDCDGGLESVCADCYMAESMDDSDGLDFDARLRRLEDIHGI